MVIHDCEKNRWNKEAKINKNGIKIKNTSNLGV